MSSKTTPNKANLGSKTSVKGSSNVGKARSNYTRGDSRSHSAVHKPVPGKGEKSK